MVEEKKTEQNHSWIGILIINVKQRWKKRLKAKSVSVE